MKCYEFGEGYKVMCRSERTRYGFRHLCELTHNYNVIAKTKSCYYNRTWECYEFQSVIHQAINAAFDNRTRSQQKKDRCARARDRGKAVRPGQGNLCSRGPVD